MINRFRKILRVLIKKEVEYCPVCGKVITFDTEFNSDNDTYLCPHCRTMLFNSEIPESEDYPGVLWYCDDCGALLNKQKDFSGDILYYECRDCGFINRICSEDIYGSKRQFLNSRYDK